MLGFDWAFSLPFLCFIPKKKNKNNKSLRDYVESFARGSDKSFTFKIDHLMLFKIMDLNVW